MGENFMDDLDEMEMILSAEFEEWLDELRREAVLWFVCPPLAFWRYIFRLASD